jgi:hypothetical protein
MGCCFSKQPDNDKSTTGTSGLDSPLLGGNSERSDLQPTQPVSSSKPRNPEIQAELDNRKKERDEKNAAKAKQRREQGAANVAAIKANIAERAAERLKEVERRNAERALKKS